MSNIPIHDVLSEAQIAGIKAGLASIAQGCVTLIKVLSMAEIPEDDKYPEGRPDER